MGNTLYHIAHYVIRVNPWLCVARQAAAHKNQGLTSSEVVVVGNSWQNRAGTLKGQKEEAKKVILELNRGGFDSNFPRQKQGNQGASAKSCSLVRSFVSLSRCPGQQGQGITVVLHNKLLVPESTHTASVSLGRNENSMMHVTLPSACAILCISTHHASYTLSYEALCRCCCWHPCCF